jgi:WS/DGAT/MGAT family acyltransferase
MAPCDQDPTRGDHQEEDRVPDRLTPLDVSFLYLEEPTTAMHTGSVMVFQEPPGGVDYEGIVRHVAARIAFVPRYRQRLRWVPARLGNPVWVDDEGFDISYHVRRSALPRPGTTEQLQELVARLQARCLDRSRPLWELIVVEGLADGGFAVVTKVHQALVDGVRTVDLGQVVLDAEPNLADPPPDTWLPTPEPTLVELVAGAVAESVRRPRQVVETVRGGLGDVRIGAGKVAEAMGGVALAARAATRPTPRSPLNRNLTEHRRFLMVRTALADYREIRGHHSGGADTATTVNDVVLATLAGALRSWLLARGEPVPPDDVVRALVPMSVREDGVERPGALGNRVASLLVDLPTGEPNPVVRLHQVAFQTRAHREAGQAVDAPMIAGIAGFAPPTLHSLGARLASSLSRRLFNLVVTNVPGPQRPLYLRDARMLCTHPVVPLARGQALSVGLTSYAGGVFYGLYADREAMADLDVLGRCIREALAELAHGVP